MSFLKLIVYVAFIHFFVAWVYICYIETQDGYISMHITLVPFMFSALAYIIGDTFSNFRRTNFKHLWYKKMYNWYRRLEK